MLLSQYYFFIAVEDEFNRADAFGLQAFLEPVTLPVTGNNVRFVGQAIQQRRGQDGLAEDLGYVATPSLSMMTSTRCGGDVENRIKALKLEFTTDRLSYEDCNDADFLCIDPALRLAIGKDHKTGASQSMLSRLENDVLGNVMGLEALDGALTGSADALEAQKAADYRPGFHRGPGPRKSRRGCRRWPFWQELFPSAYVLHQ
jgi:hypothetical protein